MTLVEELPPLILRGRKAAGLTQAQLAARVGVTQSTVSRWERGIEAPSLESADLVLSSVGMVIRLDTRSPSAPVDDGVDRAQIQAKLRMTPEERLDSIRSFSSFVNEVERVS